MSFRGRVPTAQVWLHHTMLPYMIVSHTNSISEIRAELLPAWWSRLLRKETCYFWSRFPPSGADLIPERLYHPEMKPGTTKLPFLVSMLEGHEGIPTYSFIALNFFLSYYHCYYQNLLRVYGFEYHMTALYSGAGSDQAAPKEATWSEHTLIANFSNVYRHLYTVSLNNGDAISLFFRLVGYDVTGMRLFS